jgi:Novel STAND NTPase 1
MDADLAGQTESIIPSEAYSAPDQPYPGLRPFRENEQRLFFGRDRQIKEILQRLERSSFAVVIGGSGSGKSSIVNAGVIPSLRKKQLRGRGDFWLTARFSPLDRPLESLAGALAELIEPKPGQTLQDIIAEIQQTLLETNSIAGFLDRYRNHLKLEEGQAPESRENANLLIVCDQFEEIFRDQNRENPETRQLVDLIVEAFRNRAEYPQLYVMIGMRSEDLHRCALYIDLPNVINQASFLTRRLDDDEIASAIIEPMRLVLRLRGIRPARFKPIEVDPWPFDVGLLRRLYKAVSSLSYNPDHLPLLQHLLSVLWRHVEAKYVIDGDKTGNGTTAASIAITPDDLAAALGFSSIDEVDAYARRNKLPDSWILERALDHAAEGVMPSQERLRRITEIMFRLLAQVDDQGIYSRRWTTRQEIADVAGTQIVAKPRGGRGLWQPLWGRARVADDDRPATDAEIEEVIRAFTSTYPFLHVLDGRKGNIDVSHEAFIRNWKTFRNWLQDERILASGFGAVRAAYERWLAKARDPHRRWFVGLRAMFGARLRSEELYEVRGWWNERRNSLPWAQRYAQGAHSEDADSRTDQPAQIGADEKLGGWRDWWHEWRLGTGQAKRYAAAGASRALQSDQPQQGRIDERMLRRLRRYHRQSFAATYFIVALPYVMALLTFIAAGWAVASKMQAASSDTQLAAFKPYLFADAVHTSLTKGQSTVDKDKDGEGTKTGAFQTATALEILQSPPRTGLVGWLGGLLSNEADRGAIYSVASERADKAARAAMGFAIWPEPVVSPELSATPGRPASGPQSVSEACQNETRQILLKQAGPDQAGVDIESIEVTGAPQAPAPLEPPGGKRLMMVRSPDYALNFFLMSEDGKCHIERLATVTIPANSQIETDPELRLVVANEKRGKQYDKTWLYRMDWIRKCKSNEIESPCDVAFTLDIAWSVHDNGPYRVVDSSHVIAANEMRYELRRDYGPMLLSRQEAAKFVAPKASASDVGSGGSMQRAVCDRSGPYVAVLTTDEGKPQNGGRQFDVLRIFHQEKEKQCAGYASERTIMSYDLQDYSIVNLAFPEESRTEAGGVPDNIYLRGREDGVVYSLVWNPKKIKAMLCEIVRKQNGDRVPPMTPENRYLSPKMKEALSAREDYMPSEICKG